MAKLTSAPNKKGRRKQVPGTPATLTKHHPKGKHPLSGHEERLSAFVKRALKLKQDGFPYHEIAATVAREFELVSVPAITTVAGWIGKAMDARNEDIQALQVQMRLDQFNQLEAMKQKWLPLALAQQLEVTRWVRVEGELQPELDENAVKEQLEATAQVVKIMDRQAKLLGLDLEKAKAETGDGPANIQELQLWMIRQVQVTLNPEQGGTVDVHAEVLSTDTGIPEIMDRV